MITRERFEVILNSIANGEPIVNARNRLELLFSAIAEKIGSSGGGSTYSKTLYASNVGEVINLTNHTWHDTEYILFTYTQNGINSSALLDSSLIDYKGTVYGVAGMVIRSYTDSSAQIYDANGCSNISIYGVQF